MLHIHHAHTRYSQPARQPLTTVIMLQPVSLQGIIILIIIIIIIIPSSTLPPSAPHSLPPTVHAGGSPDSGMAAYWLPMTKCC